MNAWIIAMLIAVAIPLAFLMLEGLCWCFCWCFCKIDATLQERHWNRIAAERRRS